MMRCLYGDCKNDTIGPTSPPPGWEWVKVSTLTERGLVAVVEGVLCPSHVIAINPQTSALRDKAKEAADEMAAAKAQREKGSQPAPGVARAVNPQGQ